MKVECPSCQTKYNLPDDKVGPDGANVRCSVCKHVFRVEAQAPDDFPGFGESGASAIWPVGTDEEFSGDFASKLEQERQKDPYDSVSVSSSEFTSIDFGKPEKPAPSGKPGARTLILAAALGVVVLTGISATAAYFFEFWPFAKKTATSAMENAPPPVSSSPDYKQLITFDSYNFYTADNDKLGRLYVIEGKVVNKTPVNIGAVSIEAVLVDATDAPVLTKVVKGGPKASLFELRTLSKEDLESRLASTQETLLYNKDVKPGEEIPFMAVFWNVPPNVASYTLKVKEYFELQTPPQPAAPKK